MQSPSPSVPAGSSAVYSLVDLHRPTRNPDGYPPSVRARVVAWARPLRDAGEGWSRLARAVGLSPTTLKSWLVQEASVSAKDESGGPWLPVRIDDVAVEGATFTEAAGPNLVTPSGLRVENIGEDLLLRILRELA
jgi:hypothetical protein